jgi:hypothetical protein
VITIPFIFQTAKSRRRHLSSRKLPTNAGNIVQVLKIKSSVFRCAGSGGRIRSAGRSLCGTRVTQSRQGFGTCGRTLFPVDFILDAFSAASSASIQSFRNSGLRAVPAVDGQNCRIRRIGIAHGPRLASGLVRGSYRSDAPGNPAIETTGFDWASARIPVF